MAMMPCLSYVPTDIFVVPVRKGLAGKKMCSCCGVKHLWLHMEQMSSLYGLFPMLDILATLAFIFVHHNIEQRNPP